MKEVVPFSNFPEARCLSVSTLFSLVRKEFSRTTTTLKKTKKYNAPSYIIRPLMSRHRSNNL